VGVPHEDLGTVLAVVLTAREDHRPLLEDARSALHGAHRPRLWFHVEELPATATGKVDRAALVSQVSGAGGRSHRLL
jgi:acyl-coenzyme A synthetase/AMP-(fatty) acid ligase